MKKLLVMAPVMMMFVVPGPATAGVAAGGLANNFTLTDVTGQIRSLSDYRGKYVVLEWFNYDCPFVKKQYGSGNMQSLQKEFTDKGVVWLSINSSAVGKQGYCESDEMAKLAKERNVAATAVLLDPDGMVGHLYDAKTTPHMFVINPEGILIYQGAIDSDADASIEGLDTSKNYVQMALNESMEGKAVSVPFVQSYGCSVKY